jgi:ATP-dependent Lon protease
MDEIKVVPLLPLRGMLVFPGMIINLDVGRDRSIKAVEAAMAVNRKILLVTQREAGTIEPSESDLFTFGVIAEIKQLLKLPNGALRILVEGLSRAKINTVRDNKELYFEAEAEEIPSVIQDNNEVEALKRMLIETFEQWILASKKITSEVLLTFKDQPDPGRIADMIAGYLTIGVDEKETILETVNVKDRMNLLYSYLCKELEIANIEKNISLQVRKQIEQNQREYYLREQMKAINKELGEGDERQEEVDEYKRVWQNWNCRKMLWRKSRRNLTASTKCAMMAESAVIRSYLDALLSLPGKSSPKITLT